MITKITMHRVATYTSPTTIETDKKVNIIYGLNGTGKSTLSNFLYNTKSIGYENCSIVAEPDELILTYNQKFIYDHFHVANQLKGIFSLSKENKEIELKIESAEKELQELIEKQKTEQQEISNEEQKISQLREKSQDTTWNIKKEYSGGDRVLEYCLDGLKGSKESLYSYLEKINKPSSKPEKTIEQIKREVEAINGDTAQKYELLQKFSFNEAHIESNSILQTPIIGSNDSPIAELIEKLSNSDWVRQGLKYLPEEKEDVLSQCPFCQERTISNKLEKEIKNYFNENYEKALNNISEILNSYKKAAESLPYLEAYRAVPFSEPFASELTETYLNLEKSFENALTKIKRKISNPSTSETLEELTPHISKLNSIIDNINTEIEQHNSKIDNSDQELISLKSHFWSIQRWEYDQTISLLESESKSANELISEARAKKLKASKDEKEKRNEIAELQKSTINIDEAVAAINRNLEQLGITGFYIEKHQDSLYKIVRTGKSDAIFSSLSEGEKTIISFLYFCELCKGKREATETTKKRIAVIDDPVSSLSHIYMYNIGHLIKSEFFNSPNLEQIFVLTHSLYFFYELTDSNHQRRKEHQKLFRLSKNNEGTNIKPMKYEEIQNDYHSYWSIVQDRDQPPALIANCMRNIVEYFFNFVQKADLSNVIQKPELQENRFQAFCRYINRESHSLGQNIFDLKEFNYDDFREGLKRVFEATGYPEHYEKMTSSIND
ncbi:AAA family ATPase [Pseudomonas sp. 273]|uniref:AAA family ATPase n=1 Tax=Pseudomonas sp. 273 TaxID=75692 RepID=UPI0023D8AE09|nr:AAA family ATPase [Pseudomonas sp. 273]